MFPEMVQVSWECPAPQMLIGWPDGPFVRGFHLLGFLVLSSVSLLLFSVSAAREGNFLSSDVLAATCYGV